MLQVGIVVFPQVEELDFIGPFEVLSYVNKIRPDSLNVSLVGTQPSPIRAFNGLTFHVDATLATCPQQAVLVIPGGKGRTEAMYDPALLAFVRKQAAHARFVTSVCTGAFVLAEAGLLRGKTVTTYHTALDELAAYPDVTVVREKVVDQGQIITAAGVSSGIELGLCLLARLFGQDVAQTTAQRLEYAVDPSLLSVPH